ncbi:MAG: hypothetical protein OEU54_04225 [Gemmatimonadota bacterium]|nr:hypothetical protein [Gemmatimonadota bacterium]
MVLASRAGLPGTRDGLVRLYYGLTPVFALLDLAFGVSVRAAGIPRLGWRVAYYAFALGCWLIMRRRPRWTPIVGIGESSVSLFLLIYSIMGPIFALPAAAAGDGDIAFSFGPAAIANLLLAGSVIILSFHRHQADLANLAGPSSRR